MYDLLVHTIFVYIRIRSCLACVVKFFPKWCLYRMLQAISETIIFFDCSFFSKIYNRIIHTRKSLRMAVVMAHTSCNNRKRYRGYKWWWLINKRITMFSLIFDNSLTFLWKVSTIFTNGNHIRTYMAAIYVHVSSNKNEGNRKMMEK